MLLAGAFADEVRRAYGRALGSDALLRGADTTVALLAVPVGGFCIGGLVAFEMADQLRGHGERVDLIHTTVLNTRYSGVQALRRRVRADGARPRGALRPGVAPIRLPQPSPGRAARAPARAWGPHAGGVPPAARSVLHGDQLMYRYARLSRHYIPRRYTGGVALLWPEGESALASVWEPPGEWRALVPAIQMLPVPGEHLSCSTTHAETLARQLRACLDDARTGVHPVRERGSADGRTAAVASRSGA